MKRTSPTTMRRAADQIRWDHTSHPLAGKKTPGGRREKETHPAHAAVSQRDTRAGCCGGVKEKGGSCCFFPFIPVIAAVTRFISKSG